MKLEDVRILELLPVWMRRDGSVIGLAQGSGIVARDAYSHLRYLTRWDKIDRLSGADLDELAWELNILWYNSTAPVETKRQLIKSSDLVFARLGTRWAVERVTSAYFGNARLYEWFEYGGDPHFFKVQLDFDPTQEQKDEFRRILEIVKRKSQWLELFVIRTVMTGVNKNELDFVRLVIHWRASNWKRAPVRFNAAVNFDGSIRWDQQVMIRNVLFLTIHTAVKNRNELAPRAFFFSSFQNQNSVETKPAVRFHAKNENAVRGSEIGIYTHEKNRQGNSAQLITNISFLFNGKKNFDGRKKFNSGVTVDL